MSKTYSNETIKLLCQRASCRIFQDKNIPDEVLNEVIQCGIHAATGGNLQPYSIIKITSNDTKNRLVSECDMQPLVKNAPVNLLFCIDWRRIGRWCEASNAPFVATKSYRHFWIALQDTIICAQNICTAADSVGLGSVYIGTVESCFMELKSIFNIPEGVFPVVLLSIGYPNQPLIPNKKLGIEGIVHEETYTDLPVERLIQLQDEKYDYRQFPLSTSNMESMKQVTLAVGGEEYSNNIMQSIVDQGYINRAQHYFGLHYKANWSCIGNMDFINALKSYGFPWIDGTDFPNTNK
ncbi:MAG: nitroreductase family protein [Clostridium sp.]|uniref:nitroreductase family protein n=1 Tax=Clostridium sp. TaxID=1506 RepID=UPI0030349466